MSRVSTERNAALKTDDGLVNELLEIAREEDNEDHDYTAALMREAAARLSSFNAIRQATSPLHVNDFTEALKQVFPPAKREAFAKMAQALIDHDAALAVRRSK